MQKTADKFVLGKKFGKPSERASLVFWRGETYNIRDVAKMKGVSIAGVRDCLSKFGGTVISIEEFMTTDMKTVYHILRERTGQQVAKETTEPVPQHIWDLFLFGGLK